MFRGKNERPRLRVELKPPPLPALPPHVLAARRKVTTVPGPDPAAPAPASATRAGAFAVPLSAINKTTTCSDPTPACGAPASAANTEPTRTGRALSPSSGSEVPFMACVLVLAGEFIAIALFSENKICHVSLMAAPEVRPRPLWLCFLSSAVSFVFWQRELRPSPTKKGAWAIAKQAIIGHNKKRHSRAQFDGPLVRVFSLLPSPACSPRSCLHCRASFCCHDGAY